ncbi:UNVERIFIED_CONTAM: hypothetical protein RMT77_015664 [Armadillidium vulgare]
MDFECKTEVKEEKLDLEYDSYQQDSQIFPSKEGSLASDEGIKNEESDEKTIKSEKEFIFVELINQDVIKSENQTMVEKKFSSQNLKTLLGDVGEAEKGSKMKSTSKSRRPQSSVTRDQSLEESHLENLSCKFCNFSFKSKDKLKSHLKTHEKRKFKCAHCSYEGNSKNLKQHLLIHSNVKLFKCSECSYEFNHKGNLKRHMLIHGNIKLFKCSECSYECNRRTHLKSHMFIHTIPKRKHGKE